MLPSSRVPGVCPGGGWFWMKLIPALIQAIITCEFSPWKRELLVIKIWGFPIQIIMVSRKHVDQICLCLYFSRIFQFATLQTNIDWDFSKFRLVNSQFRVTVSQED